MLKSLLMAMLALVLVAAPVAAHEGHAHRYMGTIAAVGDGELQLKTTAGKTMVFKITDETRITRGPEKGSREDLKVGTRAVVEADGGAAPAAAKIIKLPSASAERSKSS